jgi:L-aspartate oxidase
VGADPRQELAPRDVVVRNIKRVMDRDQVDHVWLDARHLDADFLRTRFPTVFSGLEKRGLHLASELIPIAPASHYYIGGVQTDVWGRTTVPGLYACGETASTGIHGANRLASNSLLEGLVFGERTVRDLSCYLSSCDPTVNKIRLELDEETRLGNDSVTVAAGRRRLGEVMAEGCGIVRSAEGLRRTLSTIEEIRGALRPAGLSVPELELFNLLTVAEHMVLSALAREESRGVHLRSDFPELNDQDWRRHVLLQSVPGQDEPALTLSEREE